jgi:hypothetical protein
MMHGDLLAETCLDYLEQPFVIITARKAIQSPSLSPCRLLGIFQSTIERGHSLHVLRIGVDFM